MKYATPPRDSIIYPYKKKLESLRPYVQQVGAKDDGHPIYITLSDIYVEVLRGYWILIPRGFLFDTASIPKTVNLGFLKLKLWKITREPDCEFHLWPSLVHDWLYMSRLLNRKMSDKVYLRLCAESDMAFWRRRLEYRTLCVAGHSAYADSDERAICYRHMSNRADNNPWRRPELEYWETCPHKGEWIPTDLGPWIGMGDGEFSEAWIQYIKTDRVSWP